MNTVVNVPLHLIDPNPYQPRTAEDPAHVERIARSIEAEGLLQEPLAVVRNDRYVLAYGHTRLAAYRLLAGEGKAQYEAMPLKLSDDIPDERLFELAIRENSERQDLSPVEEARAMAVYRDRFGKTSAEIAALFGLAPSTVRNKLRLLDLPENVQPLVGDGLSEGAARGLLTLQKIAPAQVESVAKEMAAGGYETPQAVNARLRSALGANAYLMSAATENGGVPRAGTALWPLDYAPDGGWDLSEQKLTPKAFAKIFPRYVKDAGDVLAVINGEQPAEGVHPPALQVAEHLYRPPACTQCPYYARLDGSHFCGLKACWNRKKRAWLQMEAERISEELGIPLYDLRRDGECQEPPSWWGKDHDYWQTLYDRRDESLRLKIKYKDWSPHAFTDSFIVYPVRVGEEVKEALAARLEQERDRIRQEAEWETRNRNREASRMFLAQVAAPVFAVAFETLNLGVLEMTAAALSERWTTPEPGEDAPRSARVRWYARRIAGAVLHSAVQFNDLALGPEHIAGHLQGVALTWGISLPDDWDAQAARYTPQTEAA